VTSWMAEWPYLADVCLMIDSNIFQPFSCHMGSPVMRYMYHTDSIASGLLNQISIDRSCVLNFE
jgi:hypothetical protein